MHKFAFALCFLLSGCAANLPTTDSPTERGSRFAVAQTGEPVELVGILAVVGEDRCRLASGCGPKYRIFSEDFDDRVPLQGEIDDTHDSQAIRVRGVWTFVSDEDRKGLDRKWGDTAVEVTSYEVLSPLKYQQFLVAQANEFTQANFGCESLWDRSFKWRINNNDLSLIIRLTQGSIDGQSQPFLELWFDAESQALLRQQGSDEDVNPCQSVLLK